MPFFAAVFICCLHKFESQPEFILQTRDIPGHDCSQYMIEISGLPDPANQFPAHLGLNAPAPCSRINEGNFGIDDTAFITDARIIRQMFQFLCSRNVHGARSNESVALEYTNDIPLPDYFCELFLRQCLEDFPVLQCILHSILERTYCLHITHTMFQYYHVKLIFKFLYSLYDK